MKRFHVQTTMGGGGLRIRQQTTRTDDRRQNKQFLRITYTKPPLDGLSVENTADKNSPPRPWDAAPFISKHGESYCNDNATEICFKPRRSSNGRSVSDSVFFSLVLRLRYLLYPLGVM